MKFTDIISLSLLYGFFILIFFIIISDIFIFNIEPSNSEMAHLLVGALIGLLGNMVSSLYKNKKK